MGPIYCYYKLEELQSPANLLVSIWKGLIQSRDLLAEEAKALYTKYSRHRTGQQ